MSIVADKLVVDVADSVLNPDTTKLFRIIAADTVRSPLTVSVFPATKLETVTRAPGALIFPPIVKLFRTVAAEMVANPCTDTPDVVPNEYSVEIPPTLRLFKTVADDRVESPLIVIAFQTPRDETVAEAFAAEMDVPATTRAF